MKKTIEMDDCLDESVQSAIEEVETELKNHLKANPDTESLPDMGDLDYSGAIHEIIDGSVPIYTKEIEDTYYCHSNDIDEAFDNAGIGQRDDDCWPMGWKAAAIYCYIEEQVNDWYRNNAEDIFEAWQEKKSAV